MTVGERFATRCSTAVFLLAPVVLGVGLETAEAAARPRAIPDSLPATHATWLDEVDVLITDDEHALFLALSKDYQRDAFIDRFWAQRDPYRDTVRNEFLERWRDRLLAAYGQLELAPGTLRHDARARHLLINGIPDQRFEIHCRGMTHPLEVWYFEETFRTLESHPVLFYWRWGVGPWIRWDPFEGRDVLFRNVVRNRDRPDCDLDPLYGAFRLIAELNQGSAFHYSILVDKLEQPQELETPEWTATFAAYSTDVPTDTATFDADVRFTFPGWRQSRTVVQGLIAIDRGAVGEAALHGHHAYNLVINGEVLRDDTLFESFRYRFDIPVSDVGASTLPLVFQRYLRPGVYRVIARVEDLNGAGMARIDVPLTVPTIDVTHQPAIPDPLVERLLNEANRLIADGEASIKILEPYGDLLAGLTRFETLAVGATVDHVTFAIDGQPIMTKRRPPFSLELDFGELPRSQVLRATAYDAADRPVASDELAINGSPHRFRVRFVEPTAGQSYHGSVRARVDVAVPVDQTLERLEIYRDETRLATLYDPPFVQPILLPTSTDLTLVRAVGVLEDGTTTEDVVVINGPPIQDSIGVDFVELYTTVLDRDRRPVLGLAEDRFRVFEDGRAQALKRFDRIDNLPIHATIMLDTSASMEARLGAARDAALDFFAATVEPGSRDRIAAITFSDRPFVAAHYTNDVTRFAAGIAGAKAERGTALYDSLIYALFYAGGLQGHRAILLLSDGVDESSRFSFSQAIEYAQRAEVTIYTVGLGLEGRDLRDARRVLRRFAEETGGRSFFIEDVATLPGVYTTIQQELRAKYLLAYQSDSGDASGAFRRVRVDVSERGLAAKTIRGYYP